MKLRIVGHDDYEKFTVTDELGESILACFRLGKNFVVHQEELQTWDGQYERTVYYNAAQVLSIEVLDG